MGRGIYHNCAVVFTFFGGCAMLTLCTYWLIGGADKYQKTSISLLEFLRTELSYRRKYCPSFIFHKGEARLGPHLV